MTDSTIKTGAEDVLSSVKRLVSEEGRTAPKQTSPASPPKAGRLVLTDALRVESHAAEERKEARLRTDNTVGAKLTDAAQAPANDLSKPMRLRSCDIVEPGNTAMRPADKSGEPDKPADLADSLSAKIEALEAAIARTEDQWEPDGESDDAYAGTRTHAMDWKAENEASAALGEGDEQDDSAATFVRNPGAVVEAKDQAPTRSVQSGLPVVDEDMLSEMVSKIVRQELQGALGERITRNVRKLVRREINRALAAQDLE